MAHVAKRSPGSPGPWNATPVKPGTTLIAKDRSMSDTMHSIMDNSNISWNCLKCGLPNFSSSVLSCNSPGEPFATSSPKSIHSHSSLYHHNSTTWISYKPKM